MQYSKDKIEELRHRWTTPSGKKLLKTIKSSKCYLSPVLFRKKVHNFPGINDEEVLDNIDLRGASLSGFDFRISVEEGDNGYTENMAILSNVHFEGAILKGCNFQDAKIYDCFFENAELNHCEFKNSSLTNVQLQETDCTGVNFHAAKFINCNFSDAILKDVVLGNTIVDEKTTFGKELKSAKAGNYHVASIEYKQIKELYKNSSLHNQADEYHYKEMVAKRKIAKTSNPKRWLNYFFGDLLCKYGTSYGRVFLWSVGLILFCAGLYTIFDSLVYLTTPTEPSFLASLYFSMVSFTTVGFGDFHAVGPMRFVAAAESFLGGALIALFTVIVARIIIRD